MLLDVANYKWKDHNGKVAMYRSQTAISTNIYVEVKTSLKIPKGYSECVHRRRTDKTMIKRTQNDLQNITHKTKDRVTRTTLKPRVNTGAPKG